jgi:hypothetical protein
VHTPPQQSSSVSHGPPSSTQSSEKQRETPNAVSMQNGSALGFGQPGSVAGVAQRQQMW